MTTYTKDYTQREFYKTLKDNIEYNVTAETQKLGPQGGLVPDFGCDKVNLPYLITLALIDQAEDFCSFNCDDYAYDDLDKDFAHIREVMNKRILANVESANRQYSKETA
jgi:hypothetical protein